MNAKCEAIFKNIFGKVLNSFSLADSKVLTKIFRDEDKRRAALPLHCTFCTYIPPEDFTPGLQAVGDGEYLVREKEPPRTLLMCAVCHKVACKSVIL